jgi:hypothetical protein
VRFGTTDSAVPKIWLGDQRANVLKNVSVAENGENPDRDFELELEAALTASKLKRIKLEALRRTELEPDAPARALGQVINERGAEPTAKALEAWNARVSGAPIVDLAFQMGLSIQGAKALIAEAHKAISEDLKTNLELNRQIDLDRVDGIIRSYYPGATAGHFKSAEVILKCLAHRSKLTGIEPTFREPGNHKPENVLIWIQQQLPSINRIVDSQPIE